jgi:DNA-binding IclR family transcriptional regulator
MDQSVIKTAGRVFEVLEYFREKRGPLSVRAISEHFGYPLSSTSVLIKSIATLGYLSYDQSLRAYFPTVRVAALGDWIYESMFNGRELLKLADDISSQTGETVVLAVQNDIYAQYVHVVPSRQAIQFYIPPGTRRVLIVSGTGWALLSQQTDEAIRKLYSRTMTRVGKTLGQNMSLEDVLDEVRAVRKRGYAFSHGTVTAGAGVIAMPLPEGPSGIRLTIGVAGILDRLESNSKKLVKAIKTCIAEYQKQ